MALKTLLLRSRLDKAKRELEGLREKDADFEKREAELEAAVEEMTAETPEEDRKQVEEQVEAFETEKGEHTEAKGKLESEIAKIEEEIAAEERKSGAAPKDEERGIENMMRNRSKFFGMTIQERDAFFAREDVKDFLGKVRTCIKEKRTMTNVGIVIPDVMLELLKEKVTETSKLLRRVNLRPVAGTARQRIMGTVPEAIWTEMCAKLNELELGFNDVEIDGYKVGGFFAVCNAILEDNDVNLATELLNALAKAIGKAVDKSIIYGTGTKMPLGFVTRLAQLAKPENYSATAIDWKDLHASHILAGTGATGLNLFKEIVTNAGILNDDYSENGIVWLMNKKTHMSLLALSMDKNLNAVIVAGLNNEMPVVGGEIIELSFMPDNNIAFGYLEMYLLAERAGTSLEQSEHCRFIEDQTVFKGTARYDGVPVIPDAFALMTIDTSDPVTAVEFPGDKANVA